MRPDIELHVAAEAQQLARELLRVIAQLESTQPLSGAQEALLGEARGYAEYQREMTRRALEQS